MYCRISRPISDRQVLKISIIIDILYTYRRIYYFKLMNNWTKWQKLYYFLNYILHYPLHWLHCVIFGDSRQPDFISFRYSSSRAPRMIAISYEQSLTHLLAHSLTYSLTHSLIVSSLTYYSQGVTHTIASQGYSGRYRFRGKLFSVIRSSYIIHYIIHFRVWVT